MHEGTGHLTGLVVSPFTLLVMRAPAGWSRLGPPPMSFHGFLACAAAFVAVLAAIWSTSPVPGDRSSTDPRLLAALEAGDLSSLYDLAGVEDKDTTSIAYTKAGDASGPVKGKNGVSSFAPGIFGEIPRMSWPGPADASQDELRRVSSYIAHQRRVVVLTGSPVLQWAAFSQDSEWRQPGFISRAVPELTHVHVSKHNVIRFEDSSKPINTIKAAAGSEGATATAANIQESRNMSTSTFFAHVQASMGRRRVIRGIKEDADEDEDEDRDEEKLKEEELYYYYARHLDSELAPLTDYISPHSFLQLDSNSRDPQYQPLRNTQVWFGDKGEST
jgi:hypothetical protein